MLMTYLEIVVVNGTCMGAFAGGSGGDGGGNRELVARDRDRRRGQDYTLLMWSMP